MAQAQNTDDKSYTYQYVDKSGAFAVQSSRNYTSEEEAEEERAKSQELFESQTPKITTGQN